MPYFIMIIGYFVCEQRQAIDKFLWGSIMLGRSGVLFEKAMCGPGTALATKALCLCRGLSYKTPALVPRWDQGNRPQCRERASAFVLHTRRKCWVVSTGIDVSAATLPIYA